MSWIIPEMTKATRGNIVHTDSIVYIHKYIHEKYLYSALIKMKVSKQWQIDNSLQCGYLELGLASTEGGDTAVMKRSDYQATVPTNEACWNVDSFLCKLQQCSGGSDTLLRLQQQTSIVSHSRPFPSPHYKHILLLCNRPIFLCLTRAKAPRPPKFWDW